MPKMKLTAAKIRNLKKPSKAKRSETYWHTLDRGVSIGVMVTYGGTKTLRAMTYDETGRAIFTKLGRFTCDEDWDEAKEKARELAQLPTKLKAETTSGTFKETAQRWLEQHVDAEGLRSAPEIRRILKKYVYPKWEKKKFLDLNAEEISALLSGIKAKHGPSQANATFSYVRQIMKWAATKNRRYKSPASSDLKPAKNQERDRVLNGPEIWHLWKVTGEMGMQGDLIRLLLLTGQRREIVRSMKWEDADLDTGVWYLPQQDGAKNIPLELKLPDFTLEIVRRQKRLAGSPYVFPGKKSARRRTNGSWDEPPAFNSWSTVKRRIDAELLKRLPRMRPWVLHDLRRTARTLLAHVGVMDEVAERVLGHKLQGVRRVYNRYSYSEDIAEALEKLAAEVRHIVSLPEKELTPKREKRKSKRAA